MCGIVGAISFSNQVDVQLLTQATETLSKRGPDSAGIFTYGKVGLGHRRLSIIDVSEQGNQPMVDHSGRYVIIYNGEVYNFNNLKKELLKLGYKFHSNTDTEVVLNAWIAWGEAAINRFNGFFAFAIYDQEKEETVIVRDRFGIKPLVYAETSYGLFFSSEIKAIKPFFQNLTLDRKAINLYFQLTYIPAPFTIYSEIKKLEPGHLLKIKGRKVESVRYYQAAFRSENLITDFSEARDKVRSTLENSISDRLIADVPLGTFLSGGIDSSIVSAIARNSHKDLHTFSIGYRDHPYFDETKYAEAVAQKIGTKHHVFSLSNQDLLEDVEDVLDYLDEPFADSSSLPMHILSKKTKGHVTVALSGDGADELFGGYNKHEAWIRSTRKNAINSLIRNAGSLVALLPKSRQGKWSNLFRQIQKYRDILSLAPQERYWALASFIPEKEVIQLLNTDYFVEVSVFKEELLSVIDAKDLNRVLELDVQLVLAGDMLRKVDAMSMANGLEVRVPFLDHRLVELSFQIPQQFKIHEGNRKYVLKEAFRDSLPEEVYRRGKHGFEVPLLDWFNNELSSQLDSEVFNREKIEDQGIFQWSEIEKIRKRLRSGNPGDVHIKVWQLYVWMMCQGKE